MKISIKYLIAAFAAMILINLPAVGQYRDYATLSRDMNNLAKANPALCEIRSLVKTEGGKDILVLTIGTGDKNSKPGVAVLGGVDGSYVLGRELAAGFAENLIRDAASAEVKALLAKVTFYIFPDVSPDASEQFFAKLKYDRSWNARQTDNDRDFRMNEDPYEDLNNDGLITFIRVTDPAGTHIESTDDPLIMVPADLSKGQIGKYLIYTEGIDNDSDGLFNEDGEGGVSFNNNWTYNYEEFGKYAGMHAVSEPETKAVADFLFDRWNVFTTIAFGPQDNLAQPARATGQQGGAQGATTQAAFGARGATGATGDRSTMSVTRSDETVNRIVAEKFIAATGAKGTPAAVTSRGNFMDWAYFHYGRYSYSTPGWWINAERGVSGDAALVKFAKDNNLGDPFVTWTEIKHPGFTDRKVEVGGVKPFFRNNPPVDKVKEITESNYKFIAEVAAMHPDLLIRDLKVENTGGDIYRVTLTVHNQGLFATYAEIGAPNRFVRIPRVTLILDQKQTLITGTKVQPLARLEGNKSAEYSWLIRGKGAISVKAGDINCGIATVKTDLK
jgi:hypothetical protein